MGLSILGSTVQPGVETAEVGINVSGFSVRYFPEILRPTKNNKDETIGSVVSTVPSREFNIKGEVTGATGVMAHTFIADVVATVLNDKTTFGTPVGAIFMTDVTESQERSGNRTIDMNLRSDPLFLTV